MPPATHALPANLDKRASATCGNGCGTLARQLRTNWGVGYVEYFVGFRRTGPRAHDNVGEWTIVAPPCVSRAAA